MKLTTRNVLLAIERYRQMERVQNALSISGNHMMEIIEKLLARKLIIYDNSLDTAIITRKGYSKMGRDILDETRKEFEYNIMLSEARRKVRAKKNRRN